VNEDPSGDKPSCGEFFGEFVEAPLEFRGTDGDVVVCSRVRLLRNLADSPFPEASSDDQKQATAQTVDESLEKISGRKPQHDMVVLPSEKLEELERQFLIEFQAVIDASSGSQTAQVDSGASQIESHQSSGHKEKDTATFNTPFSSSDDTVVDLKQFDLDEETDDPFLTNLTSDGSREAFDNWNIDDLLPEQPYKEQLFDAITAVADNLSQPSPTFSSPQPTPATNPPSACSSTNIVVNEEDHLLLQVMTAGFDLDNVWHHISQADDLLEEQLCYAFSPKWGYLTACPANVGTGMRASVVLHLPALATLGRLDQVFRWLIRAGVAGRGFHGDDAWGDFYRIGNGPTLGKTEAQLLNLVRAAVPTIVAYERAARLVMLDHYRESVENQVDNAFRAIKLQVTRSDEELLSLVSSIRLGLSMGLLDQQQVKHVREMFELKRLQQQLEFAIMQEQYSTATRCRDRIRQLEERNHGH
jgi:protein-arginine kinase